MRDAHVDVGGTEEGMQRLNRAIAKAREHFA
jgi:hypothetical protein